MTNDTDTSAPGLKEIADRVFSTKGRFTSGGCGQTIEAMSRSTMHQISAWDADALYSAADIHDAVTAERDAALSRAEAAECHAEALAERVAELEAAYGMLWSALSQILDCPTNYPNATVRRMAAKAEQALIECPIATVKPEPRFYRAALTPEADT